VIRAIAFDFDGVLVESVEVKTKAFALLFAGEDSETVQQILFYHLKNGGASRFEKFQTIYRDILNRSLTGQKFQSLCQQFAECVVEEVVAAPWVGGAEQFLSAHCQRYPLFVISGTPEEELSEIVRRRGMKKFFCEVLGAPRSKEILLNEIMTRHRLAPSELVFVGDSETDWTAARGVGIPFVLRQASHDIPLLPGFSGPCIQSLTELDACLSALERHEVLKR
jgi:phosphoglycolate phosphatase-like HAD superfamily hydrolase